MILRTFAAIFLVSICCAWLIADTATSKDPQTPTARAAGHREVPDDAPGQAARPVRGASPAPVIRFGIATTFQVNVDSVGANIPGDAANEPSIAVDPNNRNAKAIGWRQFDTVTSNFRQAGWGVTSDGGRTWEFPGVLEPGVFRSDPVLGFDAEGNFYYNSLRVEGGLYLCQVFKSIDRGFSWSAPVEAGGGDKQWMTIDRTGSIGHGHIYCAWSTAAGCCGLNTFNRSTNGGNTYSFPVMMPNTPVWGTLDVDSDGNVYVCGVNPNNLSLFWVVTSSAMKDAMAVMSFDGVYPVFMNGSMGFGTTGAPNPGGLLGQAWIAVDRSGGPRHGYVYMVCSIDPPGVDPLDVHFVRSTDGGQNWSVPVRINDDAQAPGAWQWFATMSLSPNGRIDVIWNDNRGMPAANLSALYYSSSDDGGDTWTPNEALSPTFDSHIGWPNQNKIGDYYDMVSDDVGADLAWAATFNGEQDVYYSRIGDFDCNGNGVGDSLDIATKQSADFDENGIPDECEGYEVGVEENVVSQWQLFQNVPNPFNPSTTIRYEVPEGGGQVALHIFDVKGQLVRTLSNGFESGGEQSVFWDGRNRAGSAVASGLYFYRLEAPGFTQTRKMLLLR